MRPRPHGRHPHERRGFPCMIEDRVFLSAADLADAQLELETLRSEQRVDPALLEEATVTQVRIAHLERLLASATVVDATLGVDGVAGLGSFVRVRDQAGRETDYELVGRKGTDATTAKVTLSSPVGKALAGARAGETV